MKKLLSVMSLVAFIEFSGVALANHHIVALPYTVANVPIQLVSDDEVTTNVNDDDQVDANEYDEQSVSTSKEADENNIADQSQSTDEDANWNQQLDNNDGDYE